MLHFAWLLLWLFATFVYLQGVQKDLKLQLFSPLATDVRSDRFFWCFPLPPHPIAFLLLFWDFGTVVGAFFLPGGIAFFLYCICFQFFLAQCFKTHCFHCLSGSCRTTKKALVPWKTLSSSRHWCFVFIYKIFFLSALYSVVCKSTKCKKNWKLAFRMKPPMPWSSQVNLSKDLMVYFVGT